MYACIISISVYIHIAVYTYIDLNILSKQHCSAVKGIWTNYCVWQGALSVCFSVPPLGIFNNCGGEGQDKQNLGTCPIWPPCRDSSEPVTFMHFIKSLVSFSVSRWN